MLEGSSVVCGCVGVCVCLSFVVGLLGGGGGLAWFADEGKVKEVFLVEGRQLAEERVYGLLPLKVVGRQLVLMHLLYNPVYELSLSKIDQVVHLVRVAIFHECQIA